MACLRKITRMVAEAIRKSQQRFKRNYDKNLATRNKDVKIGDDVYAKAYRRKHKLQCLTLAPFLSIEKEDKTFLVRPGDEENRIFWDRATPHHATTLRGMPTPRLMHC